MSLRSSPGARSRAHPRGSALAGFALALTLLAAQALGLWHRTAHAPLPDLSAAAALAIHRADVHAPADHAHHGRADAHVFGHAAGDVPECRLFDQLMLADTLLSVAVLSPDGEPVRSFVVAPTEGAAHVAFAPYQARAPPLIG